MLLISTVNCWVGIGLGEISCRLVIIHRCLLRGETVPRCSAYQIELTVKTINESMYQFLPLAYYLRLSNVSAINM